MSLFKVAGVDASFTGFSVCRLVTDGEPLFSEWKTAPTKTLKGRIKRIRGLVDKATSVIQEFGPDLVVIEGYAFAAKGNSGISLGELGSVLRESLLKVSPLVEVSPTMLKKFMAGKGNAGKADMVSAVSRKFDIHLASDNKADSLALAYFGISCLDKSASLTKIQKETVELGRELIRLESLD